MNFLLIPVLLIISLLLLYVVISGIFLVVDLFFELPYVGAKKKQVETIMKLANVKEGETVVDLGSGDGRLLFESAKKGTKAVGYEINPFLIALTLIRAKIKGLSPNIELYKQSLWRADLKVADVIFIYALRKSMPKFEDFIYKNAQKGTRIIVNTNQFPTKKPTKSENGIFLYLI